MCGREHDKVRFLGISAYKGDKCTFRFQSTERGVVYTVTTGKHTSTGSRLIRDSKQGNLGVYTIEFTTTGYFNGETLIKNVKIK